MEQHELILELAPYMLSVSPLDCEALDLLYGFDFTYRGNHNQVMAEALGVSPALERILEIPGATVINLRAVGHDRRGRTVPSAVPHERGNADQCLPGPHGRISRGATERLRDGPAIREPGPNKTFSERWIELREICH